VKVLQSSRKRSIGACDVELAPLWSHLCALSKERGGGAPTWKTLYSWSSPPPSHRRRGWLGLPHLAALQILQLRRHDNRYHANHTW